MERSATADIAKTIGIILVVIGHYNPADAPEWYHLANRFIYAFHMPLFMFASGYIYAMTGNSQNKGGGNFILKKFKRLMIPYFSTSVVIISIKLLTQQGMSVENPVTAASYIKMFYLPEAHNDFIMAVLAEEMGFVGVTVVMILFALLFWRCYKIIMGQHNLRDRFTAFGITTILVMGAVMNLAVVMGVAPPKGVPMPLMSYGGSNLLATMLCVGLLMNFSRTADSWTKSS